MSQSNIGRFNLDISIFVVFVFSSQSTNSIISVITYANICVITINLITKNKSHSSSIHRTGSNRNCFSCYCYGKCFVNSISECSRNFLIECKFNSVITCCLIRNNFFSWRNGNSSLFFQIYRRFTASLIIIQYYRYNLSFSNYKVFTTEVISFSTRISCKFQSKSIGKCHRSYNHWVFLGIFILFIRTNKCSLFSG